MASINTCITLCHFLGLFRIKSAYSAHARKHGHQTLLMGGWGLGTSLHPSIIWGFDSEEVVPIVRNLIISEDASNIAMISKYTKGRYM